MKRYSLWHYLFLAFFTVLAALYALPNLYGENYAVQVTAKDSDNLPESVVNQIKTVLSSKQLPYFGLEEKKGSVLIRLKNPEIQLAAQDAIKSVINDEQYAVALNLAPKTPRWLQAIGAEPLKLGLDLRGGVHFLLDVDTAALLNAQKQTDVKEMSKALREAKIRYVSFSPALQDKITIQFTDREALDNARNLLSHKFQDYQFIPEEKSGAFLLSLVLRPEALKKTQSYAVEQNIMILNNRINELGVNEAVIQQQGSHQISVDLPGLQDTARAKSLIGKAATLRFQLADSENDPQSGNIPAGARLYLYNQQPVLLKNEVILRGDSITYASAGYSEDGRPNVSVRLGSGESLFHQVTSQNIGKPLAVVYVESETKKQIVDGKETQVRRKIEKVINIATINSALGSSFQITGLESPRYAQNLALLLRSGALAAPMEFVQERVVGPSLGKANIQKGILSLFIGSLLVVIFMGLYYQVFGLVADLALILNVVFIIAILSLLGATVTLPGLAGIVLTVGMAVDANVLINERIREELRNRVSPQAAISAGYDKAFMTIVDANVTTLIVALILFALSSSAVKGFAVSVIIGLLTSMVTAIFFTRALVTLIYNRPNKQLAIGKIVITGGAPTKSPKLKR